MSLESLDSLFYQNHLIIKFYDRFIKIFLSQMMMMFYTSLLRGHGKQNSKHDFISPSSYNRKITLIQDYTKINLGERIMSPYVVNVQKNFFKFQCTFWRFLVNQWMLILHFNNLGLDKVHSFKISVPKIYFELRYVGNKIK